MGAGSKRTPKAVVTVTEQHCDALVHLLPSGLQQRLGLLPPGPAQISLGSQHGEVHIPWLASSCVTWVYEIVAGPLEYVRVRTVNRPSTSTFLCTGQVEPDVEHRSHRPFARGSKSGNGVHRMDTVQR
jgi:hypothetical protein